MAAVSAAKVSATFKSRQAQMQAGKAASSGNWHRYRRARTGSQREPIYLIVLCFCSRPQHKRL